MTDWLDLESKFRAVNDPYGELRADWSQVSGGPEHWSICGSADRFARGRFEALASLAGKALSGCPNFPDDLLQNTDPVGRWLNAVRHKSHYFRIGSSSPMVSPYVKVRDGDETCTVLLGTIDRVCEASAILCLQLAAEVSQSKPLDPEKEISEQRKLREELERKHGKPKRENSCVQSKAAAEKVRAFIREHGLTQVQFCEQAKTSDKTLRRFLRTGELRRRSVLQTIATAMKTTADKLTSSSE